MCASMQIPTSLAYSSETKSTFARTIHIMKAIPLYPQARPNPPMSNRAPPHCRQRAKLEKCHLKRQNFGQRKKGCFLSKRAQNRGLTWSKHSLMPLAISWTRSGKAYLMMTRCACAGPLFCPCHSNADLQSPGVKLSKPSITLDASTARASCCGS